MDGELVTEDLIRKMLVESELPAPDGYGAHFRVESGNGSEEDSSVEVSCEKESRISQSLFMEAHAAFYESWGPHAWRVIPDYISTNAFVASSYAKMIIGAVKDFIWVSICWYKI